MTLVVDRTMDDLSRREIRFMFLLLMYGFQRENSRWLLKIGYDWVSSTEGAHNPSAAKVNHPPYFEIRLRNPESGA